MMKPGELRRILAVLSVFCICLFIYLYWQQSTTFDNTLPAAVQLANFHRMPIKHRKSHNAQWTWQCINQRCERRHVKGTIPIVSLSTCSMLCGSTQLWPQPTGPVTLGSRTVIFNHQQLYLDSINTKPDDFVTKLIQESFNIFKENIVNLAEQNGNSEKITSSSIGKILVQISIKNSHETRLKLRTDESYNLIIKPVDNDILVNVTAQTFFGARHALETLSQLIWWDETVNGGVLKILKGASIQDKPKFAYRGVMIDTARNYMSLESLRKVIVGMAMNKLNAFHWHITDSQSFPMVSNRVPQLSKNGAYGSDMVYTAEEIQEFVEFARIHGIRVFLEIDTPAHAGNGWTWGPEEGLGDLALCVNERPWSLYCGEPPCGQLNPENPNVYGVLENLYRDILEYSQETEIFHLGGDEVNLECWAQHLIKNKKPTLNYTDLHDLWGQFTLEALKRLKIANNGEQVPLVIVWSSDLSKKPYINKYFNKSNIVVQSWGASQWPDTPDLLADGYRVIISHVDAWYLDCGFGKWREMGEAACDPYRPWQTVYSHRPWDRFHHHKKQILGGEVCLWNEQFDDNSLDTRLWPRTAAFAERLWSDPQLDVNIQEDVYTRLSTQRERIISRGLGAEAMWPTWCTQNPGRCL